MRRGHASLFISMAMLCATTARAETPPDPNIQVTHKSDEHRYPVGLQGGLGAGSAALALLGMGLFAHSLDLYNSKVAGTTNGGTSCRPCSSSDLSELRGYNYSGYALMAAGGALFLADIALIALDAQYRKEHREKPVAKLGRSLALSVQF